MNELDKAHCNCAAAVAASASDAKSMNAMLADAAAYIEHLRGDIQVLQMNLEHSKAQTQRALSEASQAHAAAEEYKYKVKAAGQGNDSSGFVMGNVQASIEEAVKEIKMLPEDECKKQIKALRFRWHPDKNPVLTDLATEVSKIINAAVKRMEADLEGGGAKDSTFC